MNDDAQSDEVFEIEQSGDSGVLAHLPWWLILTVAFVVTELTAHPAIGVGVLCLKFGWDDFRTALWLRRRDPNRRRGAVCSWFYLSSGLWRVFLWSFALMLVAILFLMATEPPQARGPNLEARAIGGEWVWPVIPCPCVIWLGSGRIVLAVVEHHFEHPIGGTNLRLGQLAGPPPSVFEK